MAGKQKDSEILKPHVPHLQAGSNTITTTAPDRNQNAKLSRVRLAHVSTRRTPSDTPLLH
jgi:hypothetical protein